MLDDITFPIYPCPSCERDVVAAHELTEDDRLVPVCTRCGHALSDVAAAPRRLGAGALDALGYEVEGHGDDEGCGSGGCGACARSAAC